MASSSRATWRGAFLPLKDLKVTSYDALLMAALQDVVSQSKLLLSAALDLSSQEVAGDIMLLMDLVSREGLFPEDGDWRNTISCVCHLILGLSSRSQLEFKASSFITLVNFLQRIVDRSFYEIAGKDRFVQKNDISYGCRSEMVVEALQVLMHITHENGGNMSLQDVDLTVNFILHLISCHNLNTPSISCMSVKTTNTAKNRSQILDDENEIHTLAFVALGNIFARAGSAVSKDTWKATVEALRKVMDFTASKSELEEGKAMSRYYSAFLHCLQLVLSDPKDSLAEHVPGFVAALRMFFTYGLMSNLSGLPLCSHIKSTSAKNLNTSTTIDGLALRKISSGPYRPPHLHGRTRPATHQTKTDNPTTPSLQPEGSGILTFSSDSELSDTDGSLRDGDRFKSSKARTAAILSIQALCRAEPKSLHAQWTMLLPTHDVLHPRRYQATLMTCLLFDPILKTRMAAAATLAAMLEGPSSVFLQVAEYKETTKPGSFTTLSSSLGQILIQLLTGFLHLVLIECHCGMLMMIFKTLSLLISATPFNRLPGDLLPNIIASVGKRASELFASSLDQSNIVAISVNCLGATLSTTPPSQQVEAILAADLTSGTKDNQTLLSYLFLFSESAAHPSVRFEAFQALRAAIHNYPSVMPACWKQISSTVLGVIESSYIENSAYTSSMLCKGSSEQNPKPMDDKTILGAIKVLDELLRVVSGFKGADDSMDDVSFNSSFPSILPRPARSLATQSTSRYKGKEACRNASGKGSGSSEWKEALERHLPPALVHVTPMVRAAALTCFAGLTSSVFFALPDSKQTFIISSIVSAAAKDEVPSVRSAACRAIGVIASFPQISTSHTRLGELVNVIVSNTHDVSVSVRITAAWALANICDSLRHHSESVDSDTCLTIDSLPISLLTECALRLSKDGDKVKANAVRALGNLARFVKFVDGSPVDSLGSSYSLWSQPSEFRLETKKEIKPSIILPSSERVVQAFISCVTTGNVKVQWNVCHALRNLFLNESISLQDMAWAPSVYSILLLLLRDSSNFKIRIHATSALSVPSTRKEYGDSFADIAQTLGHTLEALNSNCDMVPSSYKYRRTLEEQLTSTILRIFSLALPEDYKSLHDFLAKRTSFLEEWLKSICTAILKFEAHADFQSSGTSKDLHRQKGREYDAMNYTVSDEEISLKYKPADICTDAESTASIKEELMQKKASFSRAIRALIGMYQCGNHPHVVSKLENLASQIR
ncbi:uncharacterized protein LOC131072109 isoform X1 [Cryptomeria japonica]|uniref:uncharacterized protein LOC131072109 isoform X1 n=3 Tax=Cryptomeria japonica TaxID=3369 RepID=UPI0027DA6ACD|nr:uncharacterized protein LOC131072109 isoform X1 [Cryptomeria japonica]